MVMVKEKIDIKKVNQKILDMKKGTLSETIKGDGVVLLKNYNKGSTKNGNSMYSGIISNMEDTGFRIWNNLSAYDFIEKEQPVAGETVVYIKYEISQYGLVVTTMEPVKGYVPDDFIAHKYNIPELKSMFRDVIEKSGASEKAADLIAEILHMDAGDEFEERICKEQAALSHHDHCQTGLLAHLVKCIMLYTGIKAPYIFLENERINDLMVIGLSIHDVGKIYEMKNGTYQQYSFITHRGLGLEILQSHKDSIISVYDTEFYYMLFAIIQQHHDEYGEGARTLYALLTHMIDDLDATLSSIDEMIHNEEYTEDAAGKKIKLNDKYYCI